MLNMIGRPLKALKVKCLTQCFPPYFLSQMSFPDLDSLLRHVSDAHSVEPEAFLRAFYAAQRGRLEQKMLFGKRQEQKVR